MSNITSKPARWSPNITTCTWSIFPAIKKIRVTYHFPAWTGMKDSVEDPGGDLRAVEGTEAEVAILTDRPLTKGVLMLGDDKQIELKAERRELADRARADR